MTFLAITMYVHSHFSYIPVFNGLNFFELSEHIHFYLGVMDLDLALRVEKPADITILSTVEEKTHYKTWERSNRLSMMYMQMSIVNNIKTTLLKTDNAKKMLKFVEERSQIADKSLAGTIMSTLTTMKFNGSRTMHEHVIEMTNLSIRLKSLGMEVDESFIVQFILNSLPSEYGPFQMNYNTMKDKWHVHELHSMLVQEETGLKNQGIHSINYVTNQGAGKKRKHANKGKEPPKYEELAFKIHKKGPKVDICHFCKKTGHFQKDCPRRKAWFEKKGKHNAYICFKSYLAEVPNNTWLLDSGCTTHVSNIMQGFLSIQTTRPNEKFVLIGNRMKAPVEVVGLNVLFLIVDIIWTYWRPFMYLVYLEI